MSKSKVSLLDSLSFQEFQDDAEFIPLMSSEDEEEMNNEDLPEILPILPLRNTVLFPGVVVPITAGRDKSIKLINQTNKEGKIIGVVNADSVVAALAQESNTRNHAEAMDIIMSPEQPKAQPHEC